MKRKFAFPTVTYYLILLNYNDDVGPLQNLFDSDLTANREKGLLEKRCNSFQLNFI